MLRPIKPYVEYLINQDYIAEFLCVNKDKPKLECNGKCQLVKEIERQQEKESFASLRILMENYPIGFVNILQIENNKILTRPVNHNFTYKVLYDFCFLNGEFHPPELT